MAIKIIKEQEQVKGAFAGGLILENKPIGFPQDGGEQQPYSNLFYWANAYSTKGGLIDLHPHKYFEIMSIVLEGEINHYDTKNDKWMPLKKGDAQIIRAGKGISHAEKLLPNSRIFQIWFDPNIKETMNKEASYSDYKFENLKRETLVNGESISYDNASNVEMDTEVEIKQYNLQNGKFNLALDTNKIYSIYLIDGKLEFFENQINTNDFLILEDEHEINLSILLESSIMVIASPKNLNYPIYNQLVKF